MSAISAILVGVAFAVALLILRYYWSRIGYLAGYRRVYVRHGDTLYIPDEENSYIRQTFKGPGYAWYHKNDIPDRELLVCNRASVVEWIDNQRIYENDIFPGVVAFKVPPLVVFEWSGGFDPNPNFVKLVDLEEDLCDMVVEAFVREVKQKRLAYNTNGEIADLERRVMLDLKKKGYPMRALHVTHLLGSNSSILPVSLSSVKAKPGNGAAEAREEQLPTADTV